MAEKSVIRAEADPRQFRALMAEIKDFDPKLARALRKNLRKIATRISEDMQSEVRKPPPSGGRSKGRHQTREGIAAGIGISIVTGKKRQGVKVTGSSRKMPPTAKPMARAYNKPKWRHPVFARQGKDTKWVVQKGNPYFGSTIKRHEQAAEDEIKDAMQEALDTVRGGR